MPTPPTPEPVTRDAPAYRGPTLMNQDWRDLTFLHWRVPPERVQAYMPPGVRPDTLDGLTYVGLIPFRMVDASPFRLPGTPYFGDFLETNVRLYSVDEQGRRGVVFVSLDADRLAIVLAARAAFGTPYRWARMRYHRRPDRAGAVHCYDARLRWPGVRGARSSIEVRDLGPKEGGPTEEDVFVSARWGLSSAVLGKTVYIPNQHGEWPIHAAEVVHLDDGLLASVGLGELAERPPDQVAFSPGVHTTFGLPGSRRQAAAG